MRRLFNYRPPTTSMLKFRRGKIVGRTYFWQGRKRRTHYYDKPLTRDEYEHLKRNLIIQ